MLKLLLATTNQNKIKEYRQLLKGLGLKILTLPPKLDFEVEETGQTFRDNAILKARAYGEKLGLPTLTDDTGLEIKALNGFPGIFSNRFANGNFSLARKEILTRLIGIENRSARFICAIAIYLPGKKIKTFTGIADGAIALKERGDCGFGYDSIFIPQGCQSTFGQMSDRQKNQLSHRYRALNKLRPRLEQALKLAPPKPFSINL